MTRRHIIIGNPKHKRIEPLPKPKGRKKKSSRKNRIQELFELMSGQPGDYSSAMLSDLKEVVDKYAEDGMSGAAAIEVLVLFSAIYAATERHEDHFARSLVRLAEARPSMNLRRYEFVTIEDEEDEDEDYDEDGVYDEDEDADEDDDDLYTEEELGGMTEVALRRVFVNYGMARFPRHRRIGARKDAAIERILNFQEGDDEDDEDVQNVQSILTEAHLRGMTETALMVIYNVRQLGTFPKGSGRITRAINRIIDTQESDDADGDDE